MLWQNNGGDVVITDKERMELLNLRKRVEQQRVEIKKLSEQLERHKEYTQNLEAIIEREINENDIFAGRYYEEKNMS